MKRIKQMTYEVLTADEVHDLLIELPYLDEPKYFFEFEGLKFVADTHEAKEFCLDYGRHNYSDSASSVSSLKSLLDLVNHGYLGSVVKQVKN